MSTTVAAAVLVSGIPSAVGSLPLTDVAEAASMALGLQPELPAAPQLPRRSSREGMLAQVSAGMAGVTVAGDGSLIVDRRGVAAPPAGTGLPAEAWLGTTSFLRAAADARHVGPLKVQVTGPVTLGLALAAGGAKVPKAFAIGGATVRMCVKALIAEAAAIVPNNPLVVVLDEPGLTTIGDASFPLGGEDTVDLLSGGLASVGAGAVAGVHCCGPTDWRLVLQAGPDLLSMPVDERLVDDAAGLASFLDRGGWIAWGAVPTDQPLGECVDLHWRRLNALWCELSAEGCDPRRLRTQAIITPACGLALHQPAQVEPMYAIVRRLGDRVHHQALAARLSAGA